MRRHPAGAVTSQTVGYGDVGRILHAVFGEMALREAMRPSATIKTVTNARFYEIKRDDCSALVKADHEPGYRIFLNLARIFSARLRRADDDTIKLTTALSIILREDNVAAD